MPIFVLFGAQINVQVGRFLLVSVFVNQELCGYCLYQSLPMRLDYRRGNLKLTLTGRSEVLQE